MPYSGVDTDPRARDGWAYERGDLPTGYKTTLTIVALSERLCYLQQITVNYVRLWGDSSANTQTQGVRAVVGGYCR